MRIDERSAGFLALGLAKHSGRPVPVVTTSGTAAANLHPAVIEAAYAHVPLLVLTADRPPELRGTGANQTIDQLKLYGDSVRLFVEVGAPEVGQEAYWRSTACRALSAALGDLTGAPGPVHLNLALRDPLVPDDSEPAAGGRADGQPWTVRTRSRGGAPDDDLPARTVVVIGDVDPEVSAAAHDLAGVRGWPVVAEPGAGTGPNVLAAPELVLSSGWADRHRPDRVLVVGRPTLSRSVGRLVASAPADVVAVGGRWSGTQAQRVLPQIPCAAGNPDAVGIDATWLPRWLDAGERAWRLVVDALDGLAEVAEVAVAVEVAAAARELLVVGSSKPVRDLFLVGTSPGVRVLANRGAAGIDGMVSTAVGAALSHGRQTYALLGDLTFLHDANGLVLGPDEPVPDLTVVVVNNDGGAIFGLLEQGAPAHAGAFERIFGTPHGVDLQALCRATGTAHALAASREQLRELLQEQGGLRVVEVRTDRHAAVELDRRLHQAAKVELSR